MHLRSTILASALVGAFLLPCSATAATDDGYGPDHGYGPQPSTSLTQHPTPVPASSGPRSTPPTGTPPAVVVVSPSIVGTYTPTLPVTASPRVTTALWAGGLLVIVGAVLIACAALVTIRARVPVRYRRGAQQARRHRR